MNTLEPRNFFVLEKLVNLILTKNSPPKKLNPPNALFLASKSKTLKKLIFLKIGSPESVKNHFRNSPKRVSHNSLLYLKKILQD